ncbi:Zinc finger, RING-type [Sesbania bispinosa]|nr:Zinc finger, RING-type [Sesbania bispinosa]
MDNMKSNERQYNYALSGKIMLVSIVVLFIVIIIMICLHVQIRWYLIHARRRHTRRPQFVFYVDPALTVAYRGLPASVISSLPVFTFSPNTHPEPVDCAVCLSEFEYGETGRVLPKCKHAFHIDCIDMWFQSHSTCPLCRASVEPLPAGETRPGVTVTEPGSSSGLRVESQYGGEELNRSGQVVSSSSLCQTMKPSPLVGVTVEIPRRNDGGEAGCETPSSFRSPMSRVLSLTRILSRERKGSVSPPSSCEAGCSSKNELDAERGGRDETQ